jgi:PAS domain S-box-containing protein
MIGVIDPAGTLRYASPSIERVLGHPDGSLIGTHALDLVHPDDVKKRSPPWASSSLGPRTRPGSTV